MFSLARFLPSVRSDASAFRADRKQVINSAGKIPGKKCKGGWISASYKCSDESSTSASVQGKGKVVRKLTAAGKESAQDLASRVRKQRGLNPLAAKPVNNGDKLAIAPQPKQKPQDPIIEKLMAGPVTAKKLEDVIAQISKGKLDDDVLKKVAIAHAARNAPRGQKAGEKLEAWELNNMKESVVFDVKPPAADQIATLEKKIASARTAKSKAKLVATLEKSKKAAAELEPLAENYAKARTKSEKSAAFDALDSWQAKGNINPSVGAHAYYSALAEERFGWNSPEERSQKFNQWADDRSRSIASDLKEGWASIKASTGIDYISQAAELGDIGISADFGTSADSMYQKAAEAINSRNSKSAWSALPTSPSKQAIKQIYRKESMKLHPDYGGTPEQFQALQSSYKDVLRRYNFDSVLPRLDARQKPKTKSKSPGTPCGNGWISSEFQCGPEKQKIADARIKSPDNLSVRSRYAKRLRKAKGLGRGPRIAQIEKRIEKRLAEKEAKALESAAKEAIAQPTKSKSPAPEDRHRTMAKSITSVEGLTSRMKAFENMAKSPSLNEKGRENASQIVQAFKEEIATREIKPLKLVRGAIALNSAIKTKNPQTAQKAAELLREGVGVPKTPQPRNKNNSLKPADFSSFDALSKSIGKVDTSRYYEETPLATPEVLGSAMRGQGRRSGGMVKGGMFSLAGTRRSLAMPDEITKAWSPSEKADFLSLPAFEDSYLKARLSGLNHNAAMLFTDGISDDSMKSRSLSLIKKEASAITQKSTQKQGESIKRGGSTLFKSGGRTYSIDSADESDRADTKSGKPGKKCKGGWTSSDNDCADDKPGPMEKAFKKEAAKRKKTPTSAKAIDTGAKSRIAGLIKKLEHSNKTERESLPEHLRSLPTESKPVIKGGSPQSRIKRLLSSLESLDKPLDQDFGKELKKRGKK